MDWPAVWSTLLHLGSGLGGVSAVFLGVTKILDKRESRLVVEAEADAAGVHAVDRAAKRADKRAEDATNRHVDCERRVAKVETRLEQVELDRIRERRECAETTRLLTERVDKLERKSNPPAQPSFTVSP